MQKIAVMTIVILVMMAASSAQSSSNHGNDVRQRREQRAHHGQRGKHLERMKKHLDLTDDQVRRIREIDSVSRADRKAKVMDVLTAEQRTKLEQHQQTRQNGKRSR